MQYHTHEFCRETRDEADFGGSQKRVQILRTTPATDTTPFPAAGSRGTETHPRSRAASSGSCTHSRVIRDPSAVRLHGGDWNTGSSGQQISTYPGGRGARLWTSYRQGAYRALNLAMHRPRAARSNCACAVTMAPSRRARRRSRHWDADFRHLLTQQPPRRTHFPAANAPRLGEGLQSLFSRAL